MSQQLLELSRSLHVANFLLTRSTAEPLLMGFGFVYYYEFRGARYPLAPFTFVEYTTRERDPGDPTPASP